jgi:hypothetical protein
MPSSAKSIRLVLIILLPNFIGTCLMIWLEAILPPGVDIMYDPFVWQKSSPNFALIKLCDAPESNTITAGLLWIENVPDITGAPSGRSANSEIDPSLLNLNSLSFSLVLIRTMPWIWLSRLGVFSCKVARTPTIKAKIWVARTSL